MSVSEPEAVATGSKFNFKLLSLADDEKTFVELKAGRYRFRF